MVPPTVERQVDRVTGAAVLWASPTRSFKEMGGVPGQASSPGPPAARVAGWTRQLVRAKMFDNLIANKDPNLGNWLVDGDWHLLLIDHSRSFTTMKTLVHKMDNIDRQLWEKFLALDESTLQTTVGTWMGEERTARRPRPPRSHEAGDRAAWSSSAENQCSRVREVLGLKSGTRTSPEPDPVRSVTPRSSA